jgi:predicted metal-dependent enzyme (double-stranded beta helix superfamily)
MSDDAPPTNLPDFLPDRRRALIAATLSNIRPMLAQSATLSALNQAKIELMRLCEHKELFTYDEFPLADDGSFDKTYRIHEDVDGGFALYVNAGLPGQSFRPHDHGGSWAIVAAVRGAERHRLYQRSDADPASASASLLNEVGQVDIQTGTAVSMLADGIHSIEALGDKPLLHLHLYGVSFSVPRHAQHSTCNTIPNSSSR